MSYRFLATDLHPVADAATAFLKAQWGIPASKIKVEQEFSKDVAVPTLHAFDREHYITAVEVSNSPYPSQLDAMIVDCIRLGLPVKLYVAMPKQATISHPQLQRAKNTGVGVLIVDGDTCTLFERALALSLVGVQNRAAEFPKRHRRAVGEAYTTFVQGDPSNGCAFIYSEIEAAGRKIVALAKKNGWLKPGAPKPPDGRTAWKKVARYLEDHLDINAAKLPAMNGYLLSTVTATAGPRNQSHHKPATAAALKKRDKDLAIRFGQGVSLLLDLLNAASPLKI